MKAEQADTETLRGPEIPEKQTQGPRLKRDVKYGKERSRDTASNRGRWKETEIGRDKNRDREMTEVGGNRDTETRQERQTQKGTKN